MPSPTQPSRSRRRLLGVLATMVLLAPVGCGASSTAPAQAPTGSTPSGELLVSAAASLADAFGAVEQAFEEAHPDVDVVLNLAGSSALREQVLEGAPADVFASANTANMDRVVAAGLATDPEVFATNRLQIAVPPDNPGAVSGLGDFDDDELLLGLCARAVPCGDFARQALANAGVVPAIDTDEPDVRALLTKIELAELDAGITYITDVAAADGAVEGIDIPTDVNVVADYPIATLAEAPNPDAAAAFVSFVRDDAGQEILGQFGFSSP